MCVIGKLLFIVLKSTTGLNSFFDHTRYHCILKITQCCILKLLITIFLNSVTQCLMVDRGSDGGEDVTVWQPYVSLVLSSGCLAGNAQ
jgi:hypothetical protein